MPEILIVDGYNIINAWEELNELKMLDMGAAREQLLDKLSEFKPWPWVRIIVVFDAYRVKGQAEKWENFRGVEIVFTREGETADTFIERFTGTVSEEYRVVVATSDWLEASTVEYLGSGVISALKLREVLHALRCEAEKEVSRRQNGKGTPLDGRIKETVRETLEEWRRYKGGNGKKA